MRAIYYQDTRGEWRWRLVAENGRIVADSAEGYVSRANAERAWKSIVEAIRAK